jgi:hypothetical protein
MKKWNINRGRADGALEELHVVNACGVGGFGGHVCPLVAIFVFDLVEDDVAPVGDGVWEDNFGHLLHVRFPGSGVSRVVITESAIITGGEPAWEASCVGFGVDIRTWTEDHVEANVFSDLEQAFEVVGSGLEVQNAILRRVPSPTCTSRLEGVQLETMHISALHPPRSADTI